MQLLSKASNHWNPSPEPISPSVPLALLDFPIQRSAPGDLGQFQKYYYFWMCVEVFTERIFSLPCRNGDDSEHSLRQLKKHPLVNSAVNFKSGYN